MVVGSDWMIIPLFNCQFVALVETERHTYIVTKLLSVSISASQILHS